MSDAVREITRCRLCNNAELETILDLGHQALTGVFPAAADAPVPVAPIELVKCVEAGDSCGLVQLKHSYAPTEMYGDNYGYRSSLNRSMVEHLRGKVAALVERVAPRAGDIVLDIGSNDGTSLSFYAKDLRRIGIDPTSAKFAKYYPEGVTAVADFFSAKTFERVAGGEKARLVTSVAMFYDLEDPLDFARNIAAVLHDGGTWHFEQSYLPRMLDTNSYDTACHEHLEYYAMKQIAYVAQHAGFRIVDVSENAINGGSFAVTAVKTKPGAQDHAPIVATMLDAEAKRGLSTLAPFRAFEGRVRELKTNLVELIGGYNAAGKRVFGLGASTKGNVLLQYCGFTAKDLPCIAEVNADKFGCFTPGSRIPIVSEASAYAEKPDAFMVLPWHFREGLLRGAQNYLRDGGRVIFPLPSIDTVTG